MNLNIFQRRSLKTKVTLFTLAIFVISIWSLAFYVSRMLREDMQRLLGEQQFSTVSFVAAEINEGMKIRVKALETVARSIDQNLLGSPAALQKMLDARSIFLDLFNAGVVAVTLDGTAAADSPVVSNRRGTNYFSNEATRIALTEGTTVIGRPVVGRVLRDPLFNINTPIRDAEGKVIGALFGVINLAKPNFLDRIGEHRYGRTGGYLLISPQHRLIVTATDKSRIMQSLPAPGINPQIDRFVQGYQGYAVYVNAVGVEILNSVKAVPVARWYLAANLPTAEAFAPIQDMQRRILLATIILTLLAGALTWWMLRRQLAPMLAAVKTLASLRNANQPAQPLPIARQDEIGELIDGFNLLLESLRQREQALEQERQEHHRAILRTAIDGFWLLDARGQLLEVNETYCRMSGYSAQELLSLRVTDLEAKETADDTAMHLQQIMAQGHGRFESQHRRKDGSAFDVEVSIQYRPVDGGRLVAFIQNITERKQAERAIKQLGRNNELLLNAVGQGICGVDVEGNTTFVNPAAERLLGWSAEELIGKPMHSILHHTKPDGSPYPNEECPVYRAFRDGKNHQINDEVFWRKDGKALPVEYTSTPILDENGSLIGAVAVFNDITERKHAEQTLRHSQQELREMSKAAHDALEAERRRTARELHDELGQSLTALKMDVESLQADLPPNEPDLGRRTQAMRAMLDGTIAATRRIAANLRPLMLDDLGLAAALDWLTHNFSNHTGIATDLVVDDSVAQVPEPIASALYRITQESLTNVAKYAQATTTEIRLEQDGDWVRLTVRDNGCGIREADQKKRGAFGLLGIRERVMLLSGEIAIRGEPGGGSELCARIPLAAAETEKMPA